MKALKVTKSTLIIAVFSMFILGCTKQEQSTTPAETMVSQDQRLQTFFEDSFNQRVANSPEFQTYLGIKTEDYGKWNDHSDAYYLNEYLASYKTQLDTLQTSFSYENLNLSSQLSYDLFVFNAQREVENAAWYRHHYVVDQFNGQLTNKIAFLQNNHKVASLDDAKAYIQRIEGLEAVLREYREQLTDRAAFGVITPAFAFPDMIKDISSLISGSLSEGDEQLNTLFADFSEKLAALKIPDETKNALMLEAAAAIDGPFKRGIEGLIAELSSLQLATDGNKGVWALPDGDKFYQNRIKHHTTLDLSAEEIHQIGLDEVQRIHGEMREIMQEVGFVGTLNEFFTFVRNDPNNFYEDSDAGREAFLADARQRTEDIFAIAGDYFNTLPKATFEVKRVEPWRENSTSIAFYNRPSQDGSRPGIYYANLKDMTNLQKYVFSAITYHEGVPGHHFQIALAQELEGIPNFRKYSGYGAYTEGWALYAEQLAREMGFYKEPLYNFGRLQNELWRSVRLVTDTGIHAKQWTREQAIQYFRDNTPISEGDIVTEVERYFVNPGQALGYKLGMIKILELRERAKSALADKFDLRDFHDAVIGNGALPLPILEQQVERYINDTLSK